MTDISSSTSGLQGLGKDIIGGALKFGENIQLMNHFSKKFVGTPELSRENWDTGIATPTPGAHQLFPVNKPSGTVNFGDQVRIKTINPHNQAFEFMYSSPLGYVWYDQLSDNNKQFWIILREGVTSTEEVKSGDLIYFENVAYPGSRLYEKDGVLCCGVSNHLWEIKSLQ